MAEDCLYPYVEKYARQGSILDLGCGPGATGSELNADNYSVYTGVDISEVAIEKARRRTERIHRSAKNKYYQSDIYNYAPARPYDVIVLGDSIYYIPKRQIGTMLHRYSRYLNKEGVFIARIRGAHPSILAIIEREFLVIEKQLHCDSEICVIVFRPLVQPS
jgi:predicted TPR repeat methyltransferase